MMEFFGKIYNWINTILADNLVVVVIVIPILSFLIKRFIEKDDNTNQIKKEKVYIPLYNMFEKFMEEYTVPEFKKDFTDIDLKVWHNICSCENKLYIDDKLNKLMGKFLGHREVFAKVWEETIESVIKQYNDISEKVDGLTKKCVKERMYYGSDYYREKVLLKKFTYALLLKKYDMAFDYIVPDSDWHIKIREEIDDKKEDPHDIVINNKGNIIPMIKSIKIDDCVLEGYKLFIEEEKQIVAYLSKRIKK